MTVEVTSVGRFSSQMLTYLGTQRGVQQKTSGYQNVFKYGVGTEYYPSPDANQVVGYVSSSIPPNAFYYAKAFFTSRGATDVYAETMAVLAIDIANITNVSVIQLLENSSKKFNLLLSDEAYTAFNMLRSSSHQVARVTTIDNTQSFKSKEIRA